MVLTFKGPTFKGLIMEKDLLTKMEDKRGIKK